MMLEAYHHYKFISVGMYDISTNSIEPIKRQEKELHIFDDYSEEVSEERQMEESVLETNGDTSGNNTVYVIFPNQTVFLAESYHQYRFWNALTFFCSAFKNPSWTRRQSTAIFYGNISNSKYYHSTFSTNNWNPSWSSYFKEMSKSWKWFMQPIEYWKASMAIQKRSQLSILHPEVNWSLKSIQSEALEMLIFYPKL